MLLLSLVKNFSLQLHHRYPIDTLDIDPHPVRFSKMYIFERKKNLVITLIGIDISIHITYKDLKNDINHLTLQEGASGMDIE